MEKDLADSVILRNVLKALGVKKTDFYVKLKYNSQTTIYNVLSGKNPKMTTDMINRIINHYPQVSYLYLTRGKGTPLVEGAARATQNNMLNIKPESNNASVESFLLLPAKMDLLLERFSKLSAELAEIKSILNEKAPK